MPVTASEAAAVHEHVRTFDGNPLIRMAILGADGVGKRSFVGRLNCNCFLGDMYGPQENEQFFLRFEVAGQPVFFDGDMLSPPGRGYEYSDVYILNHRVLRHLEACILMYDAGNPESFDQVKRYCQDFLTQRSLQARVSCVLECSPVCYPPRTPYPGVLSVFASKNDGERAVPEENGKAFADSIGASFASISVKTGDGSGREVLEDLTMRILMKRVQTDAGWHDEQNHAEIKTWIVTWQNARFWY